MAQALALRAFRAGFAALVVAAVAAQINTLIDRGIFNAANFFSFFTIESNLLAASAFLYMAARPGDGRQPSLIEDFVRGAATVYMTLTAIVFALLLADLQEELQLTTPWVDTVLHRVMPLAVIADWIADPPRTRIPLRAAAGWLGFPLIYLVYGLARGPIVDWYPYPFLDPDTDGWAGIVLNSAGIFVCVSLLAVLVAFAGNWLRDRYGRRRAPAL